VLVGVAAWYFGSLRPRPSNDVGSATAQNLPVSTSSSAPTSAAASPVQTSTVTATPTATPPPDPNVVAANELQRIRNADVGTVSLNGRWILQVASKYDGVVDKLQTTASGSHEFKLSDILLEHQQLQDRFAKQGIPVYLLKATDFGKSTVGHPERIWVTVLDPGGISSAASAVDKCHQLFPELDEAHLANTCVGRTFTPPSS
jgi:serine/threonine protein kinase, bacterial